ncbi:hypothetical protein [Halolamina rubra]|uniref:hypothetical protein n=1 Tax=Halolamina rubra TaxID=1380430 RepID=UPI000678F253|nr:hypothetical protein [Halolamina rubra]
MNQRLLWIGSPDPPAAVTRLADRRGWTVRTANPEDGVAVATSDSPVAVLVGAAGVAVDELRAAVDAAPIGYCPAATTPDGVAAAAGVDFVLPQDADAWGVEALDGGFRRAAPASPPTAPGRPGSRRPTPARRPTSAGSTSACGRCSRTCRTPSSTPNTSAMGR